MSIAVCIADPELIWQYTSVLAVLARMSLPDAISGEKIELENASEFATSPSGSASSSATQSSESSQVVLCREPGDTDLPVAEEMEESSHINGGKEYYCGFGKCRPKWLQVFRNAKFFTFLMCLNSTIEGAIVSGTVVFLYIADKKASPI